MVSPFGLQASAQCNYYYNDLLCAKITAWNGIFSFSEEKGDAGLKHRYCILGHWEQIHTCEYCLTPYGDCRVREAKQRLKNNTQVYTTQEGINILKVTLIYTPPKRVCKRLRITLR